MRTSDETTLLFAALHEIQKEMPTIKQTSMNDYYNATFADLLAVWTGVRELLSANGLSVIQGVNDPHYEGGHAALCTRLCHTSGQWIEDDGIPLLVTPDKKGNATAQQQGSAVSYARRQGICAMLGVVTSGEDDDAAAASATLPSRTQPKAGKDAPKTKKLTGPIKTMTGLKDASVKLAHDIDGCKDAGSLTELKSTDEYKALGKQLKKDWPEAHEKLTKKLADAETRLG